MPKFIPTLSLIGCLDLARLPLSDGGIVLVEHSYFTRCEGKMLYLFPVIERATSSVGPPSKSAASDSDQSHNLPSSYSVLSSMSVSDRSAS